MNKEVLQAAGFRFTNNLRGNVSIRFWNFRDGERVLFVDHGTTILLEVILNGLENRS